MFQLLHSEVAPLVWDEEHRSPTVQKILQALMDIILGQVCDFIFVTKVSVLCLSIYVFFYFLHSNTNILTSYRLVTVVSCI